MQSYLKTLKGENKCERAKILTKCITKNIIEQMANEIENSI